MDGGNAARGGAGRLLLVLSSAALILLAVTAYAAGWFHVRPASGSARAMSYAAEAPNENAPSR